MLWFLYGRDSNFPPFPPYDSLNEVPITWNTVIDNLEILKIKACGEGQGMRVSNAPTEWCIDTLHLDSLHGLVIEHDNWATWFFHVSSLLRESNNRLKKKWRLDCGFCLYKHWNFIHSTSSSFLTSQANTDHVEIFFQNRRLSELADSLAVVLSNWLIFIRLANGNVKLHSLLVPTASLLSFPNALRGGRAVWKPQLSSELDKEEWKKDVSLIPY